MEDRIKLLSATIEAIERAERDMKAAREALAKIDADLASNKRQQSEWGRGASAAQGVA